MKTNLSILAGAASLAALISGANAQTSAVTDPVGYITVNVAGSAASTTFSAIAPTLVNKVEYAGSIATISATSITVSGTPFTVGQFAASNYWVEITSGAGEGAWTNITGTPTTSSITLADDMTAFAAAGATIKIRKHVTVGEFLGATNTAGLLGGADPGLADEVVLVDNGTVPATVKVIFYDPTPGAGWTDGDFNAATDVNIEPGQGVLVKHKTAASLSFVMTGHVKTGKSMIAAFPGTNVIGVPAAVGYALDATVASSGPSNLKSVVLPGADPGLADQIFVYGPTGVAKDYFYDNTPGSAGWYDGDFNLADTTVLKEGQGFVWKRKAGATNWTAPAITIAP
jgi:uncharacterized protein (TIGR02597 family)